MFSDLNVTNLMKKNLNVAHLQSNAKYIIEENT